MQNNFNYATFASNLNYLLGRENMNGKDLAICLGTSPATIYRYLNLHSSPDLDKLLAIAEFFNVSLDWLIGLSVKRSEFIQDMSEETMAFVKAYEDAEFDDKMVVNAILAKYIKG